MENITETGKCLKVRFSWDNSFVFRETVQASEAVANFAKLVYNTGVQWFQILARQLHLSIRDREFRDLILKMIPQ